MIDIGRGTACRATPAIRANAHALGALCRAVPGRGHRADRRARSADGRRPRHRPLRTRSPSWVLKKTVPGTVSISASRSKAWCSSRTWSVPGKKSGKRASVEEVAEKTAARAQGLRARRRARHRLPLRRPVRRGGDRASRRHEQDRRRCPGASPSPTAARCRPRRRRPGPARPENVAAAQRAFAHRAMMNGLASPRPMESRSRAQSGVTRWQRFPDAAARAQRVAAASGIVARHGV